MADTGPTIGTCGPYVEVVAYLAARYGELSIGELLSTATGTVVEVFASPVGSITVIEVAPDGVACFRAFGRRLGDMPGERT